MNRDIVGKIEYSTVLPFERGRVLEECAKLYSKHYGIWGSHSGEAKCGKSIRLSSDRINAWFLNDKTNLYVARLEGAIIGYAIALRDILPKHGTVSWVTQFVVHSSYRNIGIGSHLLRHIWGMSDDYAWGLITANPYAVRALEKATRRTCNPEYISKRNGNGEGNKADKLLDFANDLVAYISKDIERTVDNKTSQVNTNFAVDHTDIEQKIQNLKEKGIAWNMGTLRECWEWFAFTFREQL